MVNSDSMDTFRWDINSVNCAHNFCFLTIKQPIVLGSLRLKFFVS
jgi:hypothetical protein